eukprot:scaffold11566_cov156-Ochromonas_danica.AAC.4
MMFVRYRLKSQIILPQLPQLLTYQNLPIAFLSFHTVLVLLGLKWFTKDLSFMCFSLLFSWSYLRFYYKWDENDVIVSNARGEDLSFVAMFPEVSHIVLVPFTTAFYNIMVLLGLFPPLEAERRSAHHLRALPPPKEDAISPKIASAPVDLVGERRRAKALKLLDAKMAELAREPEGWDDVAGEIEGNEDQTFELSKLKSGMGAMATVIVIVIVMVMSSQSCLSSALAAAPSHPQPRHGCQQRSSKTRSLE